MPACPDTPQHLPGLSQAGQGSACSALCGHLCLGRRFPLRWGIPKAVSRACSPPICSLSSLGAAAQGWPAGRTQGPLS